MSIKNIITGAFVLLISMAAHAAPAVAKKLNPGKVSILFRYDNKESSFFNMIVRAEDGDFHTYRANVPGDISIVGNKTDTVSINLPLGGHNGKPVTFATATYSSLGELLQKYGDDITIIGEGKRISLKKSVK